MKLAEEDPFPKLKTKRIHENDLIALRDLGLKEHNDFFERNSFYKDPYLDCMKAIVFCGRAATHYYKENDKEGEDHGKIGYWCYDLCLFYLDSKDKSFPQHIKKIVKKGHKGKDVVIRKRLIQSEDHFPDNIYQALKPFKSDPKFDRDAITNGALIGLWPEYLFKKTILTGIFGSYW